MSFTLTQTLCRNILYHQKRTLFHWINIQFNAVDEDRRKLLGPDRTCAEWIIRNGGSVKWVNSKEFLKDYNELPKEGTTLYIQEVDATDSSIMQNGFVHFVGCNYINKIILHKCNYLENNALVDLSHVKKTLFYLQVSSCPNITEEGLLKLGVLSNLKELLMFDFPYIKDKGNVLQALKSSLPKCNVVFR